MTPNPRGHHTKVQKASLSPDELASAPRHYSDPDATWGWDSDLDKYYYGFTLFQLSCHNRSLHTDVPLLLRFTSAKRHDSVCFLTAFSEMEKHMPALSIKNMCLDTAMDNLPTYRLLKDRGISAFIDLNNNCGRPKTIPDTIRIDKNGPPRAMQGFPCFQTGRINVKDISCGAALMEKIILTNAHTTVLMPLMGVSLKQDRNGISVYIRMSFAV